MIKRNSTLSFRVSAGLKNIIGRDLISDKYIAIFELVKNSYDAGASKVDISFTKTDEGHDQIIISDNGCGMTYDDIVEKWLFVAYSEKKPQNREKSSFRDESNCVGDALYIITIWGITAIVKNVLGFCNIASLISVLKSA